MKLRHRGLPVAFFVVLASVVSTTPAHAEFAYCETVDLYVENCPIRQEPGPAPTPPAEVAASVGGEFAAWAVSPGAQAWSGDFNGDGYNDAALTNDGWSTTPVALGNSNGSFEVSNGGQYALAAYRGAPPVEVHANNLGVPSLVGKTAYDVMTDFSLKAELGDRLGAALPGQVAQFEFAMEKIRRMLFAYIGHGDGTMEIKIVFSDGSSVVYKIPPNSDVAVYQSDRSRTPEGQVIPEAATSTYDGTYSGLQGGDEFADHLERIGVEVRRRTESAISDVRGGWGCSLVNGSALCIFIIY